MRIAILLWAGGFTVCARLHSTHVTCTLPFLQLRVTCTLPARDHSWLSVSYPCARATCRAQPVNINNGNASSHSILAVLYAIINLDPYTRTSPNAIQVATLPACYLHVTCTLPPITVAPPYSGIGWSTVPSSWSTYSSGRYCSNVLGSPTLRCYLLPDPPPPRRTLPLVRNAHG